MVAVSLLPYIQSTFPQLNSFLGELSAARADRLMGRLADTPVPRVTAGRLEDLLAGDAADAVREILFREQQTATWFLATVGGSRYLHGVLLRNPGFLRKLFLDRGCLVRKTREAKELELRERVESAADTADLDETLRVFKEIDYLRVGCRDLAGLADVREVMAELSDLAAACIEIAVDFHWQRLTEKHGAPWSGPGKGFVVLGMGKISGRELNFSSDVDLMFLRRPEEGQTSGPHSVPVIRFYESLAQAVTQSLSRVTENGFVFRVDLRLRPEGEKGELVPSLSNALAYYLDWGRTWERAALMKAVPLAGDRALGAEFIRRLEPFIYRKYLDYSTIDEMREMKLRIQSTLMRKPGINIKLGQGGIREVEFFVQALQLINGGRNPAVRSPSTCESLGLFRQAGLLDDGTAQALQEAYLFFRMVEHRIQINHQLQTHELPRTADEQLELARRAGYRNDALREFLEDLDAQRHFVGELFASLFHGPSEDVVDQCGPVARSIVEHIPDETAGVELLAKHGFKEPVACYPILKDLLVPSDRRLHSDRSRRLLERLAPLLLDELLNAPEPDTALRALDRYISSLHSRSSYLATLLENPATARFLVKILGESRFFAELLIRHPQAIDSLIGRWTMQHPKEKEPLEHELAERLGFCGDYEEELDTLRIFKHEQILRIGVSHLSGEVDSVTARWLVTELAEVCLDAGTQVAMKEMTRKFGAWNFAVELPFVILGMGKLGGMEMSYLSDVDVIFVYDPPSETIGRFSAHEWFSRLGNRLISVLSVPTAEGVVFEIDTRLRPSGQKGPLVSSLESFREYHRTTSKLWEKQSLVKARSVVGPEHLRGEVDQIVAECVLRTETTAEDLQEIARLRRRMEKELAQEGPTHVDLKTGAGGLVDVEFYVQGNILMHASRHPEVLCHNTLEALAALRNAALVDDHSFKVMDTGYRFLTTLEDRLRLMEHRSVDRMALEGEKLRGLARRMGYEEGNEQQLVDDYFVTTQAIREIYNSFFEEGAGEAT